MIVVKNVEENFPNMNDKPIPPPTQMIREVEDTNVPNSTSKKTFFIIFGWCVAFFILLIFAFYS